MIWRIVGIVGGIVGGWAFGNIFESNPMPGLTAYAAATCVGAFIGGRVLGELASLATAGRSGR